MALHVIMTESNQESYRKLKLAQTEKWHIAPNLNDQKKPKVSAFFSKTLLPYLNYQIANKAIFE